MMPKKNRVPNQREITVSKQPTNKANKYTANNLEALNEAARRLQTKGGFKLYMYLAKNQDKYNFNLSSNDFMLWSGIGYTAYDTAFDELIAEGYLVADEKDKDTYTFFDKSKKTKEDTDIEIQFPKEKVKEIREVKKKFEF